MQKQRLTNPYVYLYRPCGRYIEGTSTLHLCTIQYCTSLVTQGCTTGEARENTHVCNHDRRKGAQEDRVSVHERQEPLRAGEDLPGAERPTTEDGAEDLAAADIDVAREENGHVVRGRERVGGDVRAERGEHESEGREECRRAVVPLVDERERVPEHLVVQHDAGRGYGNADETDEREGDGNDDELNILAGREECSVCILEWWERRD